MLSTLYLTNYKNYFNRNIKREELISGYSPYIMSTMTRVNFNPGDGINAKQVVNLPESIEVNYLIVANEYNDIVSRWFILERNRTMGGQYDLTLRRDVIADYYSTILNAPMFVERGMLSLSDPMVFNDEGLTFNQIKKKEIMLNDDSGVPWIVGYFAKQTGEGVTTTLEGEASFNPEADIVLPGSIKDWEYYKYITEPFRMKPKEFRIGIDMTEFRGSYGPQGAKTRLKVQLQNDSVSVSEDNRATDGYLYGSTSLLEAAPDIEELRTTFNEKLRNQLYSQIRYEIDYNLDALEILALEGQTVKSVENGVEKLYKIEFSRIDRISVTKPITVGSSLYTAIDQLMTGFEYYEKTQGNPMTCGITSDAYLMVPEDISKNLRYNVTESRKHCVDAPYDVFAMPMGKCTVIAGEFFTSIEDSAIAVANAIGAKYSGTYLYDIQILPYCPIPSIIIDKGRIQLTGTEQYSLVMNTDTNAPESIIINVSYSNFSTNIYLDEPIRVRNAKIESQTDVYRLCSPNYNGQFEFNAAKMGGVSYFNVDCTYRPFSPYIHVNPNFGVLYGRDFDDARGLVCGGDFSMATVTDAWKQYEINNKNYLNTFNRQIENMEISNKLQNTRDAFNLVTSTVQNGILGALTGSKGMAIAGSGSQLLTGGFNMAINVRGQQEAIKYSRDQFEFSMGNIQALPYSLNRVTAATKNNKKFPFLEFYTCTETERKALEDKIRYRGMTVGRIGTMFEFVVRAGSVPNYFQAQVIKLDIDDDTHLVNAIAEELSAGVYIGGDL